MLPLKKTYSANLQAGSGGSVRFDRLDPSQPDSTNSATEIGLRQPLAGHLHDHGQAERRWAPRSTILFSFGAALILWGAIVYAIWG